MTREPRHRNRPVIGHIGRPRTSTLVLIGLFLGFLTLYVWVRPTPMSTTGNVQPVTPAHSQTPSTPATSHHTLSPSPSHSSAPSVTQTPSHTPTPTLGTSTGTGTGTATPTPTTTSFSTSVTSPASLPSGSPVQ
jgi:cytoskeletal protein RodZ